MKMKPEKSIVFVWDNFGPYHIDRLEAVSRRFEGERCVIGIELYPRSATYPWISRASDVFERRLVFTGTPPRNAMARGWAILRRLPSTRRACFFLCHYEDPAVFITAVFLRLAGATVFTMNNTKFDDKPRRLWLELGKFLLLSPYRGILTNRHRSRDYWNFLGLKRHAEGYNAVSLDRIRQQSGAAAAPNGTPFNDRHLTCVARLVPKKNLPTLLQAYGIYLRTAANPRQLYLCGSGPEEHALRELAERLQLSGRVIFKGWLQDGEIAKMLGQSHLLLLPSIEEQFGNVIIEAQAMGLPVILSEVCGARDLLVRNGINGFVVEPDNPEGMAYFMRLLSDDEALWRGMSEAAGAWADKGDVSQFVKGVETLMNHHE